jgi:glucose/arabinose dehydrogenase
MRMTVCGGSDGEGGETAGAAAAEPSARRATRRSLARLSGPLLLLAVLLLSVFQTGCAPGPRLLKPEDRLSIDRAIVEYPAGYTLQPVVRNLTGATAMTFDDQGNLIIAEGGDGDLIRIYGFRLGGDGGRFDIYPKFRRRLPFPLKVFDPVEYRMYGPVGGLKWYNGRVYVSHRDEDRLGRITALTPEGVPTTIVAGLPARGDYGVTDIAISPSGQLFFGVGAATNSGIVGPDNFEVGWPRKYPNVHDEPPVPLKLLGLKFPEKNPTAGLFGGGPENLVTGPYQAFGHHDQIRIPRARNGRPNAAVYSVPAEGGSAAELMVWCYGVRMPRGLAYSQYALYMTNNGMELRGSRPVKDDPDALLKVVQHANYGWPDHSADLRPISDPQFQPPTEMILPRGYPELSFLINHEESGENGLLRPTRDPLQAVFPSQSGAAKMAFVPGEEEGPFSQYRGSVIVALSGDRAPFGTSGRKLTGPIGYKIVRVDMDARQVKEFVRNVSGTPAHLIDREFDNGVDALERPCDVKFGPDGALYILDMGRMQVKNGKEVYTPRTGQIFRLAPTTPDTKPPVATDKD